MMKTGKWVALISIITIVGMFSVCRAEAGTGTLKVTFKYKDPATGVEQNLNYGFIYLHNAAKDPPLEKFFTKADYILGPSNSGNGVITCQVPEGSYYIRITQRKDQSSGPRPYGPPGEGDYTWMQPIPITITAGGTLDLGTKYAYPFARLPITISGTITTSNGAGRPNLYVRAQPVPCIYDTNTGATNQCGPVKYLALQKTDANGKYTIVLKDPGTYYLYYSSSWDTTSNYNPPSIVGLPFPNNPVTVKTGDHITVNCQR